MFSVGESQCPIKSLSRSFKEEWPAIDIRQGIVYLGNSAGVSPISSSRNWKDIDSSADDGVYDVVYCDGCGDGGIDVALLERSGGADAEESEVAGDSWYLVQSKYGAAFQGPNALAEGLKIIDTLDGRRDRLSCLAEGLLERLCLLPRERISP